MKKRNWIVLFLLLVVVGCKLPGAIRDLASGGKSGDSSSSGGTATGGADPKEDVIQASRKFIALPYFTANMEGVGQSEIRSRVAYSAPDRFHIKYLGGTGAGMEMIMIGKDMFMKSGDKWTKAPGGGNIPTLRDSFTEEGLKTLSDVKFEGEDSVGGKTALMYTYKNVTPQGAYPFSSKIWVGKESGVPMKIIVEYTNNTALKNMTINYDTETPVTIEAPIK